MSREAIRLARLLMADPDAALTMATRMVEAVVKHDKRAAVKPAPRRKADRASKAQRRAGSQGEQVTKTRRGTTVKKKAPKSERRIKAWWFAAPDAKGRVFLPHGDGREVKAGETLSVEGEIVCCSRGLHASVRPLDALQYAPGGTICRVEVWGDVQRKEDKIAGRHRKVLWMADATTALRIFACDCADEALHRERKAGREPDPRSWEAVRVARLHAIGKASNEELAAAWDTARAAAGPPQGGRLGRRLGRRREAENKTLVKALMALAPPHPEAP